MFKLTERAMVSYVKKTYRNRIILIEYQNIDTHFRIDKLDDQTDGQTSRQSQTYRQTNRQIKIELIV